MTFNLIAINGWRAKFEGITNIRAVSNVVILSNNSGEELAVINLAPGEYIERQRQ